ncbi:MAG: protocatechuate 3,4-dioxygenase subunit alpha [Chloroflexota bacterium]
MLPQTPSQTVGPFFAIGMVMEPEHILASDQTQGERISIVGQLLDGDGEPITDGLIEIWQPDANGVFNHPNDPNHGNADPNFNGFGRSKTEDNGAFRFDTIKPGAIGNAAPYINVRVFSRGMLLHAVTRIYFEDETANASDTVLSMIDSARRSTLIASRQETGSHAIYHFDVRFQGENETVFFDV